MSLMESDRNKIDKFVPIHRNLEIVLNPVSNAYSSLLPSPSTTTTTTITPTTTNTTTTTTTTNGTTGTNNNNNNNIGLKYKKNITFVDTVGSKPGIYHLCQFHDCQSPLMELLNSNNNNNNNKR